MSTSSQKFPGSRHSTYDEIENAFQVHSLNVDHFLLQKIYARVNEVVDPSSLLCDIDEAHCCTLAEQFHIHNYHYGHIMMTVYFSSAVSPEGATHGTAVHNVDNIKLLKEAYCMFMPDGSLYHRSVVIV